jgi:hypothetical protein
MLNVVVSGLLFSRFKVRSQTLTEVAKDDEDPEEIFIT